MIKPATGITDFSGKKPLNYSYEDLVVNLDPRVAVADQQQEWVFTSSTFMIAAVLDANYNPLPITDLLQPDHNSLVSKVSFDNTNNDTPHTFIIRTVPRNDVGQGTYTNGRGPNNNIETATGVEASQPMTLSSGNSENILIPKTLAKQLLLNEAPGSDPAVDPEIEDQELDFTGTIGGSISFNKQQVPFPYNFFIPNNSDISIERTNHVYVDFTPAIARFDKNSLALGDREDQNLGFSYFALNGSMNGDDFNTNTQPKQTIDQAGDTFSSRFKMDEEVVFNGAKYYFTGWNTKADGTGMFIDEATKITKKMFNSLSGNENITLFAVWTNLSIQGVKTWKDQENADGKRPESITVHLLRDGKPIHSQKVTADEGWKWTFDQLQKFEAGQLINYSIAEDPIAGYSTELLGNVEEGFELVNSQIPVKLEDENKPVEESKPDQSDKDKPTPPPKKIDSQKTGAPKTGDKSPLQAYLFFFVLSLISLVYIRRRKNSRPII